MDARRKVSIDALSFSPRSQSSDQNLQKNIPDLGPKANLNPEFLDPGYVDPRFLDPGILDPAILDPEIQDSWIQKSRAGCVKSTLNLGPGTLNV